MRFKILYVPVRNTIHGRILQTLMNGSTCVYDLQTEAVEGFETLYEMMVQTLTGCDNLMFGILILVDLEENRVIDSYVIKPKM